MEEDKRHAVSSPLKFDGLSRLVWNEEKFQEGIANVCQFFGVANMYEDQITVLRKFFKGQNVYFSAPTGYGKSLIFQSIPMLADHLLDKPLFTSIILVVSPLKALMYDQVTYLTDTVCMNVVAITNESNADIVETIERGEKRIIYTSRESMLAINKWRNILSHETFKENCIGVIFDEAHCIRVIKQQTVDHSGHGTEMFMNSDFSLTQQFKTQCEILWQTFASKLGPTLYLKGDYDPKQRLVEMFHAGTPKPVKEHIIFNATHKISSVRVIICTTAFGMGINCIGFNSVIHFGPSKNLEAYMQECGRVGRDGTLSISHILYNNLLSSKSSGDMKDYIYSKECRRKTIAKWFNTPMAESSCPCCDICAIKCECDVNRSCQQLLSFNNTDFMEVFPRTRKVSQKDMEKLQVELLAYMHHIKEVKDTGQKNISSVGATFKFTEFQVNQLLKNCNQIFTFDDIMEKIEIWRIIHAKNILVILSRIFDDIEADGNTEIQFSFLSEDEEMLPEWVDMRDDSYKIFPFESGLLAEIDSVINTIDEPEISVSI
eukprot:gene12398-13678_t